MISFKWYQVNAWRLAQHSLAPRLERQDFLQAAVRTGGIQAQVMSAAELAFWARVDDLARPDVASALWQDRTLVKTWAMRGTLHLIAATDFPLYMAARSLTAAQNWEYYFDYYGVSAKLYQAYRSLAPQILGSEPMTREQFAATLLERTGSTELNWVINNKGWGTPLKPLAWDGDLCFGPNQGQNVTFVNPHQWIGDWEPIEPYTAIQEVARRYLRAYGPATPEDFAHWWGGGIGLVFARKLFKSIENELEPVDVQGWKAYLLSSTLEQLETLNRVNSVNLLPSFDAYTLGIGRGVEIEPLIPREFQIKVYRPQGWISAVILVDGMMKGTWEIKKQRSEIITRIYPFGSLSAASKKGIEKEAERLGVFLNAQVDLAFEEPG